MGEEISSIEDNNT
jgi:hypothetical protein